METDRIKTFSDYEKELSLYQKVLYDDFIQLNEILEFEELGYSDIRESYERCLLEREKNIALDNEIKRLINDEKVAVNKILDFASVKFRDKKEFLKEIIESTIGGGLVDKVVDYLWKIKYGKIHFDFFEGKIGEIEKRETHDFCLYEDEDFVKIKQIFEDLQARSSENKRLFLKVLIEEV